MNAEIEGEYLNVSLPIHRNLVLPLTNIIQLITTVLHEFTSNASQIAIFVALRSFPPLSKTIHAFAHPPRVFHPCYNLRFPASPPSLSLFHPHSRLWKGSVYRDDSTYLLENFIFATNNLLQIIIIIF